MAKKDFWSTPVPALILLLLAVVLYWALFFSERTSILKTKPWDTSSITLIEPAAEAAWPVRFCWAAPGEQFFRLALLDTTGKILWEKETRSCEVVLPDHVSRDLEPAATYQWRVEQLDSTGNRIAEGRRQVRIRIP